jgi:hypothetical protein
MSDREDKTPCAACGLADYVDGPDPGVHWTTRDSDDIALSTCSEECSAVVESWRIDGWLEPADPEWDGYASQRDLLAATVYNARARSPREMTPERWRVIKKRFGATARQCLEQADAELEDM